SQARGSSPPLPRSLRGTRHRDDAQKDGAARVQAGHPPVERRRLGGAHHGATGLGHPLLWSPATVSSCSRRSVATSRQASRCSSSPSESGRVPPRITVELIDHAKPAVEACLGDAARRLPGLRHADLRVEVVEGKWAAAENGAPKGAGDDERLALGVRVLAGERMIAPGYVGLTLGAADLAELEHRLRDALETAHRRATFNAEAKSDAREKLGPLGEALADTRLAPVAIRRDTVAAVYRVDPRAVALAEMVRYTAEVSRAVVAADLAVKYNWVSTLTQLARELFASTEGALIDQTFALTQGSCSVVAVAGAASVDLHDIRGHQRGWEILLEGIAEPWIRFPTFHEFSVALAREAAELAAAPPLRSSDRETVVVTDPHYNTLVAHEIIGHPVELDRALKMETAYAGRSWLLRGLTEHHVGRPVASPLVTAYSDPSLPGYGHYAYDHEGTPARRVVHIDRGVLRGFMNSRQTAAIFGGEPNGDRKSTRLNSSHY